MVVTFLGGTHHRRVLSFFHQSANWWEVEGFSLEDPQGAVLQIVPGQAIRELVLFSLPFLWREGKQRTGGYWVSSTPKRSGHSSWIGRMKIFLAGIDLTFWQKSQFSSARNPLSPCTFSFCARKKDTKALLLAYMGTL